MKVTYMKSHIFLEEPSTTPNFPGPAAPAASVFGLQKLRVGRRRRSAGAGTPCRAGGLVS